jgi:tRNA A-37 threonylcarbamoyl transferase component Bud32
MKPGDQISHYRVVSLLGAGGMGEVYKAEDTRLKRQVALKVLTPALGEHADAKQRLIVEAQAASALDHPNICTIYEIDETAEGRVFLVMAYYEGETLGQRLARGLVPVDEAIEILIQLTRAVAAAHGAGMIHRDIKPANIFLTSRSADDVSRVKLLDFGIAKIQDQTSLTRTGSTVGTLAYMAPEHIAGHAIDQRADIWAIGVVGYELFAGRRPFDGSNAMALMKAIVDEQPASIASLRPDAPPPLDAILQRALAKRTDDRYASARECLAALESLRPSMASMTMPGLTPAPRRTQRWVMAGVTGAIVVAAASWLFTQRLHATEVAQTVADFRTLVESEKYTAAFRKLHTLRPELIADPAVTAAARDFFLPLHINTDPPGADVLVKGYDEPGADWIALGTTPIDTRGGAVAAYRWRISKPGYETFEGSGPPISAGDISFNLLPQGTIPPGMVRVPGTALPNGGGTLPDFFMDRYEVTNKAFKAFVDAGGYRTASYWPATINQDGKTITWQQLVEGFRDTTGRPGPATWELGSYPDGQAEYPVAGISWFEAEAYARFTGRSLPTVYHWRSAAQRCKGSIR